MDLETGANQCVGEYPVNVARELNTDGNRQEIKLTPAKEFGLASLPCPSEPRMEHRSVRGKWVLGYIYTYE